MIITNRAEFNAIRDSAVKTRDINLLVELTGIAADQGYDPTVCAVCEMDFDGNITAAEIHEADCVPSFHDQKFNRATDKGFACGCFKGPRKLTSGVIREMYSVCELHAPEPKTKDLADYISAHCDTNGF